MPWGGKGKKVDASSIPEWITYVQQEPTQPHMWMWGPCIYSQAMPNGKPTVYTTQFGINIWSKIFAQHVCLVRWADCQESRSCVPFRATSQCAGYTVGVNLFLWWPDIIGKAVIAAVKSLAPSPLAVPASSRQSCSWVNSLQKRSQHFCGCERLHLKGQLPLKPPHLHIPLLASPSCKGFRELCKGRRCTDAHLVHLKL